MNIERIKEELARTYAKIEKLQKKARDLEEQKKQAEDMEYLKIIRSNGVSAEELQLMIDISKEEQKKILERSRQKMKKFHKRAAVFLTAATLAGLPAGAFFYSSPGSLTVWADNVEVESSEESSPEDVDFSDGSEVEIIRV